MDQAGIDSVLDGWCTLPDTVGMRDYNQYCPVALASEVLADRWTPLIVRELVLGSHRFNDIDRGRPASPGACCCNGCCTSNGAVS